MSQAFSESVLAALSNFEVVEVNDEQAIVADRAYYALELYFEELLE